MGMFDEILAVAPEDVRPEVFGPIEEVDGLITGCALCKGGISRKESGPFTAWVRIPARLIWIGFCNTTCREVWLAANMKDGTTW